ncbi:hypothetical protein ISS09_02290 [Candidatus Woesearchaeota archaeon]|nr:hypothetical protein [Candidatus Woesearchaeota archaeon]
MAYSLEKDSNNKIITTKNIPLKKESTTSIITLLYDSLRQKLESLALKKGYKVYNHECYYSFLNEILSKKDLAEQFNRFRKIRNRINYYGENISLKDAIELIKEINNTIKQIQSLDLYAS